MNQIGRETVRKSHKKREQEPQRERERVQGGFENQV